MENKKNINELKIRLLKEQTKKRGIKKEIARIAIKNKLENKNK
jgi:hypothetical protein